MKVFLSSPYDVEDERAAARLIVEQIGERVRALEEIEVFDCTTHPTEAIDVPWAALLPRPDSFDFFVGIYWRRLGTPLPTSVATSEGTVALASPMGETGLTGTVYEYEWALHGRRESGRPRILMYRKMAAAPPVPSPAAARELADDWAKVGSFDKRFVTDDKQFVAARHEFSDLADFRSRFRTHARAMIEEILVDNGHPATEVRRLLRPAKMSRRNVVTGVSALALAGGFASSFVGLDTAPASRETAEAAARQRLEQEFDVILNGRPDGTWSVSNDGRSTANLNESTWPVFVSSVASAGKVVELDIRPGEVAGAIGLSTLTSLKELRISRTNRLTLLDLEGCETLSRLELRDCSSLVDVIGVERLAKLEVLTIGQAQLIPTLGDLRSTSLIDFEAIDTDATAGWTDLRWAPKTIRRLSIPHSRSLESCDGIERLSGLEQLDLSDCASLTSIVAIASAGSLTGISLPRIDLSGAESLAELPRLEIVEIASARDQSQERVVESLLARLPAGRQVDVRFRDKTPLPPWQTE